jgi:hypothetical protein
MKSTRYLAIILATLLCTQACKKDNIDVYAGETYVQFSRGYADSSLFSFLALPNSNEGTTPLAVELVGFPENRDRHFNVTVVKELSTAPEANYVLPKSFTLRANRTKDTVWMTLKKTPEIAIKPVKLVLKLEPTTDFKVGQSDHAALILYISNIVARPDWWDGSVEGSFLGEYSDKKYKLFIDVTGRSELDNTNEYEVRYYTTIFKNYLLREKDAGRTVYEDNGSEMTVAMIGG